MYFLGKNLLLFSSKTYLVLSRGSGLKIATNNFSYEEVLFLADILRKKYNLKVSVLKSGVLSQYVLYISKSSMNNLIEIVKPYFHPSMYYKLNGYIKF